MRRRILGALQGALLVVATLTTCIDRAASARDPHGHPTRAASGGLSCPSSGWPLSSRPSPVLRVCGSGPVPVCPDSGRGRPVQDPTGLPLLDNPFDVRVALVPGAYVAPHYPARYIAEALCALEAAGWLLLDMDTVVVSEDLAQDLAAALKAVYHGGVGGEDGHAGGGGGGVAPPVHLARVALALFYPRPYIFQLWNTLDAFPGALAVYVEDVYRSAVLFAPLLGWVTCAAAAVAQMVFVRGGGVAETLLPNCEWLLEGTGGVGEGAKAVLNARVGQLRERCGHQQGPLRPVSECATGALEGGVETASPPRSAPRTPPQAWAPFHLGPDTTVVPVHHGAGPAFVRAGEVASWRTRAPSALYPAYFLVEQYGKEGCDLHPLRLLAGQLPSGTLVTPWPHVGLYNSSVDGEGAAQALAAAMAGHRIVIASGVFATCAMLRGPLSHTSLACGCQDGAYPVARLFEAMAAGAAVVTDAGLVPHLASLGFVQGVHFLAVDPFVEALQSTLLHWLHNRDPSVDAALEAMAARGQALVRGRYQTGQQAQALVAALSRLQPRSASGPDAGPHNPPPGGTESKHWQGTAGGPLEVPHRKVPPPDSEWEGWGPGQGPTPTAALVDGVEAIQRASFVLVRMGDTKLLKSTVDIVFAWVNRISSAKIVLVPDHTSGMTPDDILRALHGLGVDVLGGPSTVCINVGVQHQAWLLGVPYIVMEAEQPSGPFFIVPALRVRPVRVWFSCTTVQVDAILEVGLAFHWHSA